MAHPSRQIPGASFLDIGVIPSNRASAYAARWLRLLHGHAPPEQAKIMITGGENTDVAADCVIRLWDYQVGRPGSGALASAISGASAVIGHAEGTPLFLPADMPEKWCGVYGVILALAETWRKRCHEASPHPSYDVSAADILRSFSLQNAGTEEDTRKNWKRNGRFCVAHGGIFPMGFFTCRDGHVAILGRSRRDWRNIRNALDNPQWADAERFQNPFAIAHDSAEADRLLEQTLSQFNRDDLLARGLASEAVIAPVFSTAEAQQRRIFRGHFIADDSMPTMPFLATPFPQTAKNQATNQPNVPGVIDAPLAGLRCIELSWIWSGPMLGQILGDLGAQVIKIEAPNRFDLYRTRGLEDKRGHMRETVRLESSYQFHSLNRNKIGMTLDLKQHAGLDIAKRLTAESDLLIENFTVGTMTRLGLGTDTLAAVNPALVQVSMSGPGRGSAVQGLRSYGLVLSALAGAESLIQDKDGFLGSPTFSLSDPNAAAFGAMIALAGVLAAKDGAQGFAVDISQIEAAALLASDPLPKERHEQIIQTDNGDFVALSVPLEHHSPETVQSLNGKTYGDVTAYAGEHNGHSAKVLPLEDTVNAPEFSDCPGWIAACHPFTGEELLVAAPWRVNGHRPALRKPAPVLGEGDDFVLRHILSLSEKDIETLADAGVTGAFYRR